MMIVERGSNPPGEPLRQAKTSPGASIWRLRVTAKLQNRFPELIPHDRDIPLLFSELIPRNCESPPTHQKVPVGE